RSMVARALPRRTRAIMTKQTTAVERVRRLLRERTAALAAARRQIRHEKALRTRRELQLRQAAKLHGQRLAQARRLIHQVLSAQENEMVGGSFAIRSAPGNTTTVRPEIPREKAAK